MQGQCDKIDAYAAAHSALAAIDAVTAYVEHVVFTNAAATISRDPPDGKGGIAPQQDPQRSRGTLDRGTRYGGDCFAVTDSHLDTTSECSSAIGSR